jgi:Tol biopolymer transport system component
LRKVTGFLFLVSIWISGTVRLAAGQIELISRADPAPDSSGTGILSAMSADGRYVVFQSDAPNLVPGQVDANNAGDLFLRDRVAGTTSLLSHQAGKPTTASPMDGIQDFPDAGISADGRWVVFASPGTRLVPGQVDDNESADVFLQDRATGATTLISHAAGEPATTAGGFSGGVAISADGSAVVFISTAGDLIAGQTTPAGPGKANVYLYQRSTGVLALISHRAGSPAATANEASSGPAISADGGTVVFVSRATDLLSGVTGPGPRLNAFLWQRSTGSLALVSHAAGAPLIPAAGDSTEPQISADGRWIAFESSARNLVAGETSSPGARSGDVYLFDRMTGLTRLVSHASTSPNVAAGISSPDFSGGFALSADGRWLAFTSGAPNVVPGQAGVVSNGTNVFLYDRISGSSVLVSHRQSAQTASPSQGSSRMPSVSADGRYVAFESAAGDLLPHQTDAGGYDVFLYDRVSRSNVLASHLPTSLATVGNGPSEFAHISADGSTVAFASYASNLGAGQLDLQGFQDVFLYDRRSAEVVQVTQPAPELPASTPFGPSTAAGISADGRYVAFASRATGLVPGQVDVPYGFSELGLTGTWDVFLRDRATGKTTLLSRSRISPPTAAGGAWPTISADGSFVAFVLGDLGNPSSSPPPSLVLYDRAADALRLVNHTPGSATMASGTAYEMPSISADGRWVAYSCAGCTLVAGQQSPSGHGSDLFLYDRLTGANLLVSHASGSPVATGDDDSRAPVISADGRYVLFHSSASNLVPGQGPSTGFENTFLFDRATGAVTLVSHTAAGPTIPSGAFTSGDAISADGRWVAFASPAPDLLPGVTDGNAQSDVFLYDRASGATILVSHAAGSSVIAAAGESFPASLSADGRWLLLTSKAADLLPGLGGAGEFSNVFLYDRDTGTTTLVSSASGGPGDAVAGGAESAAISADGSRIAFLSPATPRLPGDPGPTDSVSLYVQERATGVRTLVGRAHRFGLFGYDGYLSFTPQMSANGLQVAFTSDASSFVAGDLNANWDAYLYDAAAGPVAVPPCALFDGTLRSGSRRTLAVAGACGVPAGAKQALLKLTVSQGTAQGNVQLFSGNVANPSAGILRFNRGAVRGAGFTVPLGGGGIALLPFVNGDGTVRVGVEIDGYTP